MVVSVLLSPTTVRRRGCVVSVLISAASVGGALQQSAGNLRRKAGAGDSAAFVAQLALGWSADAVDAARDSSGKNALHLAAWRGSAENVAALLDLGADVNLPSTGTHNYGKTALFYAITRCRDPIVLLLLSRGARVCIVNNKGQSPLSLAASHCTDETVAAIAAAEAEEAAEFSNYRSSHSDGEEYGDLDPRYAVATLGRELGPDDVSTQYAVNPTTKQSRSGRVRRRNAAQDAMRQEVDGDAVSRAALEAERAQAEAAAKAAEIERQVEAAVAPLETMLSNAARGDEQEASAGEIESIVLAADVAVASLAGIRGAWLSVAAARLHRCASRQPAVVEAEGAIDEADGEAPPLPLLLRAADVSSDMASRAAASAEEEAVLRVATLRTRLLRLAASPLLLLGSTTSAAPLIVPPIRPLLPKATPPPSGWPRLSLPDGVRPMWVESVADVQRVRELLSGCEHVGIDTEWADDAVDESCDDSLLDGNGDGGGAKARDDFIHQSRLATIQLAAESEGAHGCRVYVIDALNGIDGAESSPYHLELSSLLEWLLADDARSPQLVGFAFSGDAHLIAKYLNTQSGGTQSSSPATAASIRQRVIDVQPTAVAFGVGSSAQFPSLRVAYEAFVGRTMSKEQQMSDWTARPLSEEQLEYAALDALACVRLREEQERRTVAIE